MKQIEQTISSIEVAEMVGKEHSKLLRDIRNYITQLSEAKIGLGDFFTESTYKDANNQSRPCFNVTKKGCEFIAHKLTGTKGTEFTARYINRFHEMENVIRDGIPEEKSKKKKEKLSSVNQMAKNISGLLGKAGVDIKFIAAEVVRIYTDNGYPVRFSDNNRRQKTLGLYLYRKRTWNHIIKRKTTRQSGSGDYSET